MSIFDFLWKRPGPEMDETVENREAQIASQQEVSRRTLSYVREVLEKKDELLSSTATRLAMEEYRRAEARRLQDRRRR